MDHFDDDQYRAIGRVVVAASQAEWMIAVLASCYIDCDGWETLKAPGGAIGALQKATKRRPQLTAFYEQARDLLNERHRVVHDIAISEHSDGGETPIMLITNRPFFESRLAPTTAELEHLVDQLRMIAAKALASMPVVPASISEP